MRTVLPELTMRMPAKITYLDIAAWLLNATDGQRRKLADDSFSVIDSDEEKMEHIKLTRLWMGKQWMAENERGEAVGTTTGEGGRS